MELCVMERLPQGAHPIADDASRPLRVLVLDGRTSTPSITRTLAARVAAGGCIVILTTPRRLESANTALEQAGFGQPRLLRTEDQHPTQPWGMGQDETTYAVMARHKKGPFVFNERYHSGRLNGQPNDPSPEPTGELKGAQGAVARTDKWPLGEAKRIRYTVSEVFSIHSLVGDLVAVDRSTMDAMDIEHDTIIPVLYRTRPEKPALSPQAQKRKEERAAQRAALANEQKGANL